MKKYVLQSDEILLYENQVNIYGVKSSDVDLILTNLHIILEINQKIGFMKYETIIEQYSVNDIKLYNEKPQIIQKKDKVTIYFINKELEIEFESFLDASRFVNKANEAITNEEIVVRGAGKVKKAIGLVDDTLGINITSTIAGVIENGAIKTLFKGTRKQQAVPESRLNDYAETISTVANAASMVANKTKETDDGVTEKTFEQCAEEIKKLKELLDIGAISQEEFDIKKKELLGL